MKEFVEIPGYGKLFVDKVIFESYFPIIFTCVNDNKDLFLCVCCKNNEQGCKWLVGKTFSKYIISMLRDEITVRELLINHSVGRITVDYVNEKYTISYDNSDWKNESIFLPKEDSYLDAEEDEFTEEINYYSSFNMLHYSEAFYKNISSTFETAISEISPLSKVMLKYAAALEKLTISGEANNTLTSYEELYKNISLAIEKYTNREAFKPLYIDSYDTSEMNIEIKLETSNNTLTNAA